MKKLLLLLLVAAILLPAVQGTIFFNDSFNRGDSSTLGNNWVETLDGNGNAEILSNEYKCTTTPSGTDGGCRARQQVPFDAAGTNFSFIFKSSVITGNNRHTLYVFNDSDYAPTFPGSYILEMDLGGGVFRVRNGSNFFTLFSASVNTYYDTNVEMDWTTCTYNVTVDGTFYDDGTNNFNNPYQGCPTNDITNLSVILRTQTGDTTTFEGFFDDIILQGFTADTTPPIITNATYNVTSVGTQNESVWRTNNSQYVIVNDTTPTIVFDTDEIASCAISIHDENFTTMLGNDTNTQCSTANVTSHTCTLPTSQFLESLDDLLYFGCQDDEASPNESPASTSGALSINLSRIPDIPTLDSPANSTVHEGNVTLTSTGTDADGQSLTIEFYTGSTIDPTFNIGNATGVANGTSGTFDWSFNESGVLYWRTRSHDGANHSSFTVSRTLNGTVASDQPTLNSPVNGTHHITRVVLNVSLTHPENTTNMTVIFVGGSTINPTTQIGNVTGVNNGTSAAFTWEFNTSDGSRLYWRARGFNNPFSNFTENFVIIGDANFTVGLTSAVTSLDVIPTKTPDFNIGAAGQTNATGTLLLTNNANRTINFSLKIILNDTTIPRKSQIIETFILKQNWTIQNETLTNSTFNWTTTCLVLGITTEQADSGTKSGRLIYNFGNVQEREFVNASGSEVRINHTWACPDSNKATRALIQDQNNWTSFDQFQFSYYGGVNGVTNETLTINITATDGTSVVSPPATLNETAWRTINFSITGIDRADVANISVIINETEDSNASFISIFIDDLHIFNSTVNETDKIIIYASNASATFGSVTTFNDSSAVIGNLSVNTSNPITKYIRIPANMTVTWATIDLRPHVAIILNFTSNSTPINFTVDVLNDSNFEFGPQGIFNTSLDNLDLNASAFQFFIDNSCNLPQCDIPITFTSNSSNSNTTFLDIQVIFYNRTEVTVLSESYQPLVHLEGAGNTTEIWLYYDILDSLTGLFFDLFYEVSE